MLQSQARSQIGCAHRGTGGGKTAIFAHEIDDRIRRVWRKHPHLYTVQSLHHFLEKAAGALEAIRALVPQCCLTTPISFK